MRAAHKRYFGIPLLLLLVGSVFVAVSGLVYFAFMAAWLNVFLLFGYATRGKARADR